MSQKRAVRLAMKVMGEMYNKNLRNKLDKDISVLDLRKSVLLKNIKGLKDLKNADKVINKFYEIVDSMGIIETDATKITTRALKGYTNKEVLVYKSGNSRFLVGKNFRALREFLTMVGKHPDLLKTAFGRTADESRSLLDLGHTASYGLEEKNTVLGNQIIKALTYIKNAGIQDKNLREAVNDLEDLHLPYTLSIDKKTSALGHLGEISFIYLVPQAMELNNELSKEEQKISKNVINYLQEIYADLEGSPSPVDDISETLSEVFLNNKAKPKTRKNKVKGVVKGKSKLRSNSGSLGGSIRDRQGRYANILKLQAILNESLEQEIKDKMAPSGAPVSTTYLRYQSGRFAKSAKITNLTATRENLIATYTFDKQHYGSFLPGGRRHSTGRNPKRYISSAIREIAIKLIAKRYGIITRMERT